MGIAGGRNALFQDVLENGQASQYASYFDIDWAPLKNEMRGQVLLPTLGDQYGRVLEKGELKLDFQDGAFVLRYWDLTLPISPRTYQPVLEAALERLGGDPQAEDLVEFESILTAVKNLPDASETSEEKVRERAREKEVVKRRLAALSEGSPRVLQALQATAADYNGTPGEPRSFDRLDALICRQNYRLAYWRVAGEEINYRRFFEVNELAAVRMERPEVFAASHRLLLDLIGRGELTGLRIDHPDGLLDPAGYFLNLQVAAAVEWAARDLADQRGELTTADRATLEEAAAALAPQVGARKPLYLVAEKIVEHGERLPDDWAVHGTTGYEYLNAVNGLFVDATSAKALTETYRRFTDDRRKLSEIIYESKRRVLRQALVSELNVLAHALNRISEANRLYRDFTLNNLTFALREVIASFPVYRTYLTEASERPSEHDREAVESAVRLAKRRNPAADPSVFEFLRSLLLLEAPAPDQSAAAAQLAFVMKFQQLTGPVMAKGLEDTAFYIYNRLASLNEVGGDPDRFGTSVAAFHAHNAERAQAWPHTMNSTSTHDTKRSEDVRARIDVLTEFPEEWRAIAGRLSRHNRSRRVAIEGDLAPSRNDEYLLYQTLVGVWPLKRLDDAGRDELADRLVQYVLKAAREAKERTSWVNQNAAYEAALESFTRAVVNDGKFLATLEPFLMKVARYGILNSLAVTVLKLASPGVPDTYQGNESWDFSLVDPDNRRRPDFARLERDLASLEEVPSEQRPLLAEELIARAEDGRVKLWVTRQALTHRRDNPDLYALGDYHPLDASGTAAQHVVAFSRNHAGRSVAAVVPRLLARLSGGAEKPLLGPAPWEGTTLQLAAGRYHNLLTGETVESDGTLGLAALFASFPAALLERQDAGSPSGGRD